MATTSRNRARISFGSYELDAESGELFKHGIRISLPRQPGQILRHLLANPGVVVTREELRDLIWGGNTFVDFEHGLNAAMNRLRRALNDSAESPRFIQTLPGRGYRFIEAVTMPPEKQAEPVPDVLPPSPSPLPPAQTRKPRAWLVVCVLFVAIAAFLATVLLRRTPSRPLARISSIVLADFANYTNDPVFDGTIRQGIAIQLDQSPSFSLISDERVHHILRLMSKAPDTYLGPDIGRAICERTGGDAVLDGSIAMLGTQYLLVLNARDCGTGKSIFRAQQQARQKGSVLAVLGQMVAEFRSRAGGTLAGMQKNSISVTEATTPSIEALKAYTKGLQISSSNGFAEAIPHIRRATELDPQFALAYAFLGRFYGDTAEPGLAEQATRKAFELRNNASERARFFITFSYDRQILGNLQKAQQILELWAQTYPLDGSPHSFLSGLTTIGTARYEAAIEAAKRAIALNPDAAAAYANLAGGNLYLDRLGEAAAALERAANRGLDIDDFLVLRYNLAFLKNDSAQMEHEVALAQGRRGAEDWMYHEQALVLARQGRLHQSELMSERAVALSLQNGDRERAALFQAGQAVYQAVLGDATKAKKSASAARHLSQDRDVQYAAAFSLALAGDTPTALSLADDLAARFPEDTLVRFQYLPVLRALLALKRADAPKAADILSIRSFDLAFPRTEFLGSFGALYPVFVRGLVCLASHQGAAAAAEFQEVMAHQGLVLSDPTSARARLELGRALVMSGDKGKARDTYRELLQLWKDADPGLSVLKQAKEEYSKLL